MLDIQDLHCGYRDRAVLAGVDLTVRPGEFVGLLGPNGSGKTTLLRAVTGVLRPSAGCVRIGGEPTERLSARALARRVAVVPQETTTAFPFSVREIVEMGRYAHGGPFGGAAAGDAAAVRGAMERTGVLACRHRTLTSLSAGERQRVMLARALAQEAALLLVDEPTAHMDVRYQVEMLELLRGLCGEGRGTAPGRENGTLPGDRGEGVHPEPFARAQDRLREGPLARPKGVLAVLHDLNLALRFCTRVLLMAGGRIVADGPPPAVLTAARIGEVFGAPAEVVDVSGNGRVVVIGKEKP